MSAWPHKAIVRKRKPLGEEITPCDPVVSISLDDDLRESTLCVVTVCIGNAADGLEAQSIPAMRAYAARCDADFRVIRSVGDCQHPKYAVMQIHDLFKDYERILYLDADVMVRPNAPDIFASHPAGKFYARNEAEWMPRSWCVGFLDQMNAKCGTSLVYDGIHFNGGVQLADRAHRELYRMPPWDVTKKENTFYDAHIVKNQPWFNHRRALLEIPFAWLDEEWNAVMGDAPEITDRAYFLHACTEQKQKGKTAAEFFNAGSVDTRRVCVVTVAVGKEAQEAGSAAFASRRGLRP